MFIIFLIGAIAETNRAPFDLAEAESELVSGFMTEHAAVIFVFFFLAEYASIVLICILLDIFFLGGYLLDLSLIYSIINLFEDNVIYYGMEFTNLSYFYNNYSNEVISEPFLEGIISSITLGIKACIMVFIFI